MPLIVSARISTSISEATTGAQQTKSFKSGNSVALRLPKGLGVSPDERFEISRYGDTITARLIPTVEEEAERLKRFREGLDRLASLPRPHSIQDREEVRFDFPIGRASVDRRLIGYERCDPVAGWQPGDMGSGAVARYGAIYSILAAAELEAGVHADAPQSAIRRASLDALYGALEVIPFDDAELAAYRDLLAVLGFNRPKILDRLIAATALAQGLLSRPAIPKTSATFPT